ncbi:ATP-binding protein [Acidithiobacillus ferridurans]|nr:ATP-binding protein [Acidithiobacillus ferridurans]
MLDSGNSTKVPTINRNECPPSIRITAHDQTERVPTMPRNTHLDDRYQSGSTLVTSQLPVEHWHDSIGDPTLADAILDRLIHNAYRLTIDGESMRKKQRLTPSAQSA